MFFHQISVLGLKSIYRLLVLCSAPPYRLRLFFYVDNRLDYSMYCGVNGNFLEYPWAREQKRDNGPEQGQLLFAGQGSVLFIGAVIRLLDSL